MVKKIEAYAADDGSIHATQEAAAIHDARLQLKKLDIFNEGTISGVIANREAVFLALKPIVEGK